MNEIDWTGVVASHQARLRRYAARRVPAAAVDDVVQETFMRAYRSRHTLDTARPIGPWLTTIARHVVLDVQRVSRVAARHEAVDGLTAVGDAASAFTAQEQLALIRRALDSLSTRHRRLLEQVAIEGVSQTAIARREGVAPEAVRAAVMRARQRFRMVYERLVQEQGLAGLGGSMQPVVSRLRQRVTILRPFLPDRPELASVVVALLAAGSTLATSLAAAPTETAGASARPAGLPPAPLAQLTPRVSPDRAVTVRTPLDFRGGSLDGGIRAGGPLDVDTYWTLNLEPVGLRTTVGTSGASGRLDVELKAAKNHFWVQSTIYCDAPGSTTAPLLCTTLGRAEETGKDVAEP